MCRHPITRRELLGLGVGAVAGMLVLPRVSSAANAAAPVAAPPLSDLDVALKAERWIRRSRIETKSGTTWPANPLQPASVGTDLYNGMPGIILFYLELYYATGAKSWLDEARLGANELTAQLPAMQSAKSAGLYDGLAGAVFVLEETHRATGDGRYRDAAVQALGMIHGLAEKTTLGAAWPGPSATHDVISGSAGIGLLLIWADQQIGDVESRTLALATGRALLASGIRERGGLKWNVSNDVTNLYPNFSHGTAGVAFFLSTLLKASGDTSLMGGALSASRYLETVANTEQHGFKVFHHEPGGENLYYMSWCHGPAGTVRLFERMGQITHRAKWETHIGECARATMAAGVPEQQSAGYWNNVGQCCGNAGVGEFFISLQRRAPSSAYAGMVRGVAENTLTRATVEGDGLKWVQAENRLAPRELVAQTGYMQGAAGIGTFYLHADGLAKGRAPAIKWPDSAAFEPCVPAESAGKDMSHLTGGTASAWACAR